ncbi:MAG: carbon-nitrogen hydrolase family protein [Armatimonadetes bacterium]|nr:carbon-nitrogen hydrolase family protein [Armatimonadota bacterium]
MRRLAALLALLGLACGTAGAGTVRVALAQTELRLYPSEAAYVAHMGERLAEAMRSHPDLVVFPEDIGLPLALVDSYDVLRNCATVADAARALIAEEPAALSTMSSRWGWSPARAWLVRHSEQLSRCYRRVFGALARQHSVYVVAGSAPLPYRGRVPGNVACVFGPDGRVAGVAPKVNLISLEGPEGLDLLPARCEELRPVDTPLGRLGVIVCADAWDPAIAQAYRRAGAQLLVNCLANPEPWSEDQQASFDANSLPARIAETGLPGVQCFAVGRLFDLTFTGRSQCVLPLPDGRWRVVARAGSAVEEEIVTATVPLALPSASTAARRD